MAGFHCRLANNVIRMEGWRMLEQGLNEELEQYILLNYRPDGVEEKAFCRGA